MTQEQALKILKTGASVFLTGEPGSGKTYTINKYVSYLHSHGIDPAITASTGIAATHISGVTIHSWAGIGIKDKLSKSDLHSIATTDRIKKRVGKAKVLIIDEISMLPPNTLSMIEAVCRAVKKNPKPFGGMQVVLVGDFFQLPPVTKNSGNENSQEDLFEDGRTRFAYDSPVWTQAEFTTCYITEQYRQDDSILVSILSKIRGNSFDAVSLEHIQKRKVELQKVPSLAPKLFSHNLDVDRVNDQMLAKIDSKAQLFSMESKGHDALIKAMKKGCLSPENLYLKIGASVMFTKNSQKEGFVNGTLGEVVEFNKDSGLPIVKVRSGRKITVSYSEWMVEENGSVKGKLSQIPLRLAWAITVHKSQGISLDEAVIDLSRVFEFGQGYVAISRVKRLTGLHILGWNEMAFQVDPEVLQKDEEFRLTSKMAEKVFSRFKESELARLLEDFIKKCDGVIHISDTTRPIKTPKISTLDETLKLWEEGKDAKQIAKERNLVETTVLSHIEELYSQGKIKRTELDRIIASDLLKELPVIHAIFTKLDTKNLSPVFEYFKGKYSYGELRLARMMI